MKRYEETIEIMKLSDRERSLLAYAILRIFHNEEVELTI